VPIASLFNDYAVYTCKCHLLGLLSHGLVFHSHSIRASPKIVDASMAMERPRTHDIDKQTSCNLPPHFHHAHKPFTLDTINLPQDCAKDAKESTTGRSTRGSSAAWNSLDYHQLVSWLSLPQVVIDSLKRGRERRSRSSIRPMKNQAASGVNRRICLVSKMCRLSEEAQQRQPCFFAMIFRLLNGTHAIL
jgi:hypothetical protein